MEWLIILLVNLMAGATPLVAPYLPAAMVTPQASVTAVPGQATANGQPLKFADANRPNQLNSIFTFERGLSKNSRYDVVVNPAMLTLIAGSSDLTGPSVCYPVKGDFEARVYARIDQPLNAQGIGLFVRLPGDWKYHIGIVRRKDGNIDQIATPGRNDTGEIDATIQPFLGSGIYLKIVRQGDDYILAYRDGVRKDYEALRTESDFSDLPDAVEVCLNAWSGDQKRGITGIFGEFAVTALAD